MDNADFTPVSVSVEKGNSSTNIDCANKVEKEFSALKMSKFRFQRNDQNVDHEVVIIPDPDIDIDNTKVHHESSAGFLTTPSPNRHSSIFEDFE